MSTAIFKLKDIITVDTLKLFFQTYKDFFIKYSFSKEFLQHIKRTLIRFLRCRDYKKNFAVFVCSSCGHSAVRPNTCKSKLCPTCGKVYSEHITQNFLAKMIDKKHRHILFTLPDYLWNFFIGRQHLLAQVSDALFNLFKLQFAKSKVKHFAFSVFFHTFGRDMKFNPHLHIIITEGGFSEASVWKDVTHFPWQVFCKSWKKILSDVLSPLKFEITDLQTAINRLWSEESSVFFNVKGETLHNPKATVKYLGRYLARPPIAEYRITFFDGNIVRFWYIDLHDKSKRTIELPLLKFIGRIILQIPPDNFKMVRHYGLYARHIASSLKSTLTSLRKSQLTKAYFLSWQAKIFRWIGINPLLCPNCNIVMRPSAIIHNHKVYSFRN
jgi:hypothetical protein